MPIQIILIPLAMLLLALPGLLVSPLFADRIIGKGMAESLKILCFNHFLSTFILFLLYIAIGFFLSSDARVLLLFALFFGFPAFLIDQLVLGSVLNASKTNGPFHWLLAWRFLSSIPVCALLLVAIAMQGLSGID
jgi:hypothetical protein